MDEDGGDDTFKYIPDEFKYRKMCILALRHNSSMLEYVPKALIDTSFIEEVIRENHKILRHIPKHLITSRLCKIAYKHDPRSFEFIPDEYKTDEMCKGVKFSYLMAHIPDKFINKNYVYIFEHVAKHVDYGLRYIPKKYRSRKLCLASVKRNGYELSIVPENLRDLEICIIALNNYIAAIEFVPKELMTRNKKIFITYCEDAIRSNKYYFRYVPREIITQYMVDLYVNHDRDP
jgi:hypothetical protein